MVGAVVRGLSAREEGDEAVDGGVAFFCLPVEDEAPFIPLLLRLDGVIVIVGVVPLLRRRADREWDDMLYELSLVLLRPTTTC